MSPSGAAPGLACLRSKTLDFGVALLSQMQVSIVLGYVFCLLLVCQLSSLPSAHMCHDMFCNASQVLLYKSGGKMLQKHSLLMPIGG